ncbi:hypothetical protein FB645_005357 [Coemansia sp. IMI 203386]|nr:hypothetical protein FB645_005357 [Coemansia sp. IMI 203386]
MDQQQQPNQTSELFREEANADFAEDGGDSRASAKDSAKAATQGASASTEAYTDGADTSSAAPGSAVEHASGARSSLVSAYGQDSAAASAGMEGSSVLEADLDLDFNVDSLNLDNLGGLDFDMTNLLSQVSASTIAASTEAPVFDFAGIMSSMQAAAESASVSAPQLLPQQPIAAKVSSKPASSSESAQSTSTPAVSAPASSHASTEAGSANASQPGLEKTSAPVTTATPTTPASAAMPKQQQPPATSSSSSQLAAPKTPAQQAAPVQPPHPPAQQGNLPKSQTGVQPSAPVRPNTTAIRPARPSMAAGGQALPLAPASGGSNNNSSSPVSTRPRPPRPAPNGNGTPLTPQPRPAPGQGLSPGRPGMPTSAGTRPPSLRPPAAGVVRPRPGQGQVPVSPVRPGMRPVARPRPPVRPPQQGPPQQGAARPQMRPAARPAMRPALSAPVSAAGAQLASSPGTGQGLAKSPVSSGHAPLSAPVISSIARPAAAAAPAALTTVPARTVNSASSAANGNTEDRPAAGLVNGDGASAQRRAPQPLSATSSTGKAAADDDDEQFLTESVVVTAPAPLAAACSLESLYGLDGTFRSLSHGFAPTYAEWSTLNVLAATWPQLETTTTGAGRRLAQRDIPDVSSMTAADSARATAERRPASAAIRLFRLHVQPPASWDAGSRLRPMAPSLLPLCDLRMQQQWDGAADDAVPAQIADGACLNVAPLSGWHGGASQAGLRERMRAASAPRCVWSADSRILATSDRAGRFELFQVEAELNSWRSVYHVDFDCPVVACLWLGSKRKYGISRDAGEKTNVDDVVSAADGSRWRVDPGISIKRLPFFGPRNTQGGYALLVVTADNQLVLVYQRDDRWVRVVAPLEPRRLDVRAEEGTAVDDGADTGAGASARDDPWSNIPKGAITHADMMLVSKKWIYLAAHRAAASPVAHPHEPGAIADELKSGGAMTAPTVEVYRIQVEFASDYSPRLFATPLVVQPITLPVGMADTDQVSASASASDAERLRVPRVTHLKLITALNPEVRPVEKNILGENHYFPLLFVSLGRADSQVAAGAAASDAYATFVQVWRLEGAAHAQRSVVDLLRRPPPLKLSHLWTERRQGLLLAVSANRAERQQLRYLFAKASDKDYRALMLTWADGRVEMLRNYQHTHDRFDQCVAPVRAPRDCVIGGALSPHYTTYFQLVVRPCVVELGSAASQPGAGAAPHSAVACVWSQARASFRLGWTPFFGDHAASTPTHAYCGDLLAVRILNQEDPTDLVAILANMAVYEENQPVADAQPKDSAPATDDAQPVALPMSRTLAQALHRTCTLTATALGVRSLELDPLAATTPLVRRTLGAIMQIHALAQHGIQATSVGLLLHIAAVVEARVAIVHETVMQTVAGNNSFDVVASFSATWRRSFVPTVALVLWCIDLFVALVRDTYLFFNVRCPDGAGVMRPLFELDSAAPGDGCHVAGGLPTRLALLFHRPTLDALRSLMTFVAHVEMDLVRRVQVLGRLPPNAAAVPEYRAMVDAREMVLSAAQQLAHALEYLPVSMQRMKDFLADVQELYAADPACAALSAQAVLVSTSTVAEPFRKYLPRVARSFAHFILELDVVDTHASRPAAPSALVLHDTRWLAIVSCRAAAPGLSDGAPVFETPWRVPLPVRVTDPSLVASGSDALVPAAELAAWDREKSEFERALDEDNVLFDIDDPGFIFFDSSELADDAAHAHAAPPHPDLAAVFSAASARAAALAPVKITTRVPDFTDVAAPLASRKRALMSDIDIDHMFDATMLLDSSLACGSTRPTSADRDAPAKRPSRTRANSASAYSPSMTPRTAASSLSFAWTPSALTSGRCGAAAQHFVPHYSSVASTWADGARGDELSSGWQFISTPRDPKLHIPTLLAQHAFSLAVLLHRRESALPDPEAAADHACESMSYCIDWSRSDGVVVDPATSPASMCAAASLSTADAAAPAHSRAHVTLSASIGDSVDVIQKTMLAADSPIRMCLRCGHATRRPQLPNGSSSSNSDQEVGWIGRFNLMCICGGSWIAA